jgi:hypothetical protein
LGGNALLHFMIDFSGIVCLHVPADPDLLLGPAGDECCWETDDDCCLPIDSFVASELATAAEGCKSPESKSLCISFEIV